MACRLAADQARRDAELQAYAGRWENFDKTAAKHIKLAQRFDWRVRPSSEA